MYLPNWLMLLLLLLPLLLLSLLLLLLALLPVMIKDVIPKVVGNDKTQDNWLTDYPTENFAILESQKRQATFPKYNQTVFPA